MDRPLTSQLALHKQTDDARWEALLATDESQSLLEKMADEALAEVQAGRVRPMIFTKPHDRDKRHATQQTPRVSGSPWGLRFDKRVYSPISNISPALRPPVSGKYIS